MQKNNTENEPRRVKLCCWSLISEFSGTYRVKIDLPDGTKMTNKMHNRVRKAVLWNCRRRYKEKGDPIIDIEDRGWNYKEKRFFFTLLRKSQLN
jgi:hypothetical protein